MLIGQVIDSLNIKNRINFNQNNNFNHDNHMILIKPTKSIYNTLTLLKILFIDKIDPKSMI